MWKKLCLSEINPMKSFERSLMRARDQFCSENKNSMPGTVRIIIKKKKALKNDY